MAKKQACKVTGKSCVMLLTRDEKHFRCDDCERTVLNGGVIDIGFAHVYADQRGFGLRSVSRRR